MFLGLLGGLSSAAGTVAGGIAKANADRYQAQVAHNNEIMLQQQATNVEEQARASAETKSLQEAAKLGKITTELAANNVDVNTGSARNVRVSQREFGALAPAQIVQKGRVEQYGYLVNATNQLAQSKLYTAEAPEEEAAGLLGGVGQAFGAAAKWLPTG